MRRIIIFLFFICNLCYIQSSKAQVVNICPQPDTNITNLGLYGGHITYLVHSVNNKRLFAGTESPYGLFQSDDTGNTWMASYPIDSLWNVCTNRGWGGYTRKLMTNTKNWVAASTLESFMISFNGGDKGSWHTAINQYYMDSVLNITGSNISDFSITDHFIYVVFGKYVIISDTIPFTTFSIYAIGTQILVAGTNNPSCASISSANNGLKFPIYLGITYDGEALAGELYRYNGLTSTQLTLPVAHCSLNKIMVHPASITGDTLFIQITDSTDSNHQKLYLSKNAGSTWTDVTMPIINGIYPGLFEIEYNPNWLADAPISNGAILYSDNAYYSKDFGSTWTGLGGSYPYAILPDTFGHYISSSPNGVRLADSLSMAMPDLQKNDGLSAVQIKKIARSSEKHIFYLATESGLAYTTAYLDTSVDYVDKWKAPYGDFPLAVNGTIDNSITCVAVDPNDSSHVIVGGGLGFCVSKTGSLGFQAASYPITWPGININDIEFINSNIIIAITGTENNNSGGAIWRSFDGGANWNNINQVSGNALAVGIDGIDTVIYAISGRANSPDTAYIWKSTDLGLTWVKIHVAPSSTNSLGKNQMADIEVVPGTTDTLYVLTYGTDVGLGYPGMLFSKSNDGGLSFTNIQNMDGHPHALLIDHSNHDSVFIAMDNKLRLYNADSNFIYDTYTGLHADDIYDIEHGSILVGSTTGFYTLNLENLDDNIFTITEEENNTSEYFHVFPNPANDIVKIEIKGAVNSASKLKVYNLFGQLEKEYTCEANAFSIDVKSFKVGVYLLSYAANNINYNGKLIISR